MRQYINRGVWVNVGFCCLIVLASEISSAQVMPRPAADTNATIDENLFLLRNLEYTLQSWKSPSTEPGELARWMATTRVNLKRVKKMSEIYRLDPNIIRAYDDLLGTLDEYEAYLRDVVFVDLITGTQRTEGTTFAESLERVSGDAATGASLGTIAGGVVGTVTLPGIGTVAGATAGSAAGLVIGGTVGVIACLDKNLDDVAKDSQLDGKTKQSKVALIRRVRDHMDSTVQAVGTAARLLAGVNKWGTQVGFDGSEAMPAAEQLKRRPNDPFLYAGMASAESLAGKPEDAVKHFLHAANLIPADHNPDEDIYDVFRAAFCLQGLRTAELSSRGKSGDSEMLRDGIACYRLALSCLNENNKGQIPLHLRYAFAKALARSGRKDEALSFLASMQSPANPRFEYEYARVCAETGDKSGCLEHLRRSFRALPRWEPAVLADPCLAKAFKDSRLDVEKICCHRIIGNWEFTLSGFSGNICFYPDGTVYQAYANKPEYEKRGTYEILPNGVLHIVTPTKDQKVGYVLNGDSLALTGNSAVSCHRRASGLLGVWSGAAGTLTLSENGTFVQEWSTSSGVDRKSGTFAVSTSANATEIKVLFSREDMALGMVEKQASATIDGQSMKMHTTSDYEFTRIVH